MRKPFAAVLTLAVAAILAGVIALRAQEGDLAAEEDEAETAAPSAAPGKRPKTMGKDKAGIEAYLRHRLATTKATHKARLDFMNKDSQEWSAFWSKVKDERNLFEVRIARQRLDLFESLGSLEQREHATTIADFERLQGNVIRSFENAQKQKMQDFFAVRDKRWRDFYVAQEKERAARAAEVDASWDQLKAALKLRGTGSKSESTRTKF